MSGGRRGLRRGAVRATGIVALVTALMPAWSPPAPAVTPPPETRPALGSPHPDFDGDGFADLAVGVPSEDVGMSENAGGVNVLYGSGAGLSGVGAQFWSQ